MSQSRQTLESLQSDFDSIALLANENWNHNAHYHAYLLGQIPQQCRQILEINSPDRLLNVLKRSSQSTYLRR